MKKLLSLILTVFMLSGLIFSVNLNTANALSVTEHTESFEDFEGSILSYSALTEISSEHSRTGDNSLKISGDDIAQYSMNGAIVKCLDYSGVSGYRNCTDNKL